MNRYEINVSHKGKHLFATHPRSLQTEEEAVKLYEHFEKLFPKSDSYKLSLTQMVNYGKTILTNGEL